MRRRRTGLTIVAFLLALAACSSDAKSPATTTLPSTTIAPTTLPATTSPPPTSASTTSSAAPTTSPSTSAAPTPSDATSTTSSVAPTTSNEVPITATSLDAPTTASPAVTTTLYGPKEQAVRQAIQDYYVAYEACGAAPETCDPSSYLAAQGTAVAAGTATLKVLRSAGNYFGADTRGSYIVTEAVQFKTANEAIATSCWFDAGLVLGPNGPDGRATIVDDSITSYLVIHTLYLEGHVWRVGDEKSGTQLGDGNRCPPAA
jgi:hypothetical protein